MSNNLTPMAAARLLTGTGMPTRLWLDVHDGATFDLTAGERRAVVDLALQDGTVDVTNVEVAEIPITRSVPIDHWSLWDAPVGGVRWWQGRTERRVFHAGDTFRVKPGALVLGLIPPSVG